MADETQSVEPQPTDIETFVDEPQPVTLERMSQVYPHVGQPESQAEKKPAVPVRWTELAGVLALIVLCDVTIYRGHGFAGYALLFATGPVLLWLSSRNRYGGAPVWILSIMLLALATKLAWCGSIGLVAIGFGLIVAFSMAIAGQVPYVLEGLFYALHTVQSGYFAIIGYGKSVGNVSPVLPKSSWINVLLPAAALLVFGWIFVLANPNLTDLFGEGIRQAFDSLSRWVREWSPKPSEFVFWFAVLWIVGGLLRPVMDRIAAFASSNGNGSHHAEKAEPAQAFLYPAYRNTLATVIVLFAVYLVFEFQTLWFREFPAGFYYSGYAHEGAAWLTAALALATVLLSLVFRGPILRDPRIASLRKLAWVWSLLNIVLAAAVFNRLFIYVGFNGMTRMRIVGLYGMSAVVAGFILVVWKIAHNRDFLWLIRRHLWALAIAVYLLAMTPLDAIVVSYNVRRILAGDPAPSVQISVHPINAEGILLLEPLLESDNEIIREGVTALLAEEHLAAAATIRRQNRLGWTAWQGADTRAYNQLRAGHDDWEEYRDADEREAALKRFHEYAYQWY